MPMLLLTQKSNNSHFLLQKLKGWGADCGLTLMVCGTGVEHVAGNLLETEIPRGDAMLLKVCTQLAIKSRFEFVTI